MNQPEVLLLIIMGAFVCVARWRLGVLVCLAAGCLMDPIRKLVAGEPVYLTAVVGIFVAATCVGAYLRGVRLRFRPINAWNKSLKTPLAVFAGLVPIGAAMAYIRTGNPVVPLIGLLAYLSPLPAVLLGYYFATSQERILLFIKVYLVFSALMVSGVFLSYWGFDWQLLSSVGEGLVAYSPSGEQLTLLSGFFRSPEIAAWHAGASVCFLIMLFMVQPPKKILKWLSIGLIVFFAAALMLTGRRKFLVEIAVFLAAYVALLIVFKRRAVKSAALLFAAVVVAFQVYIYLAPSDFQAALEPYYERTMTVGEQGAGRLSGNTIDSFQWVIAENGIFGSGAGAGSQGSQYFGGGSQIVGGSAEGGLAKILAELGIPGLIVVIWLGIGSIRYMWSVISFVNREDATGARLTFALASFLAANALVYTAEHQAFGDVFVLVMLGSIFGFLLAMPRLAARATEPAPERGMARFPYAGPPRYGLQWQRGSSGRF